MIIPGPFSPISCRVVRRCLPAFLLILPAFFSAAQPIRREKNTPEAQLRFAEGLLARKYYDMAEDELRNFLDKHPNHKLAPEAMFRLIECLRGEKKDDETLSAINQFLARWPTNPLSPRLYLYKGELLLRRKRLDEAAACFKRLKLCPDSVTREAGEYFLAETYTRQGKIDLALPVYRRLGDAPFDDRHVYRPFAAFAVAAAYESQGKPELAEKYYARLKDSDKTPAGVREEAIYRLGELYFSRRQYKRAAAMYALCLVDYPSGAFAREARKRRAWAFLEMHDYDSALEIIQDWRKRYPKARDYEVDYVQGAAFLMKEMYAAALPFFTRLSTTPEVPQHYRRFGTYYRVFCLLKSNQYQKAAAAAKEFLDGYSAGPDTLDVHYFLGEAYYHLKQYRNCVAELRKALNGAAPAWKFYLDANLRLADALCALKAYSAAAAVYRKLSNAKGVDKPEQFLYSAGDCEVKAGKTKAAIADFEMIWKKFSDTPAARAAAKRLSELYAGQNQFDRAALFLQGLLKKPLSPKSRLRIRFFLGYLDYRRKEYKAAVRNFQSVLAEAKPKDPVTRNETKYFLTGALLGLHEEDKALDVFADLLKLPVEQRPALDDIDFLFRLEKLYYQRHQYDVSEKICRWIMARGDKKAAARASVRLATILMAGGHLEQAQKTVERLLQAVAPDALQKNPRASAGSPANAGRGQLLSLYGEILLKRGRKDQAAGAFEQSLADPNLTMEALARAHWGLAEILKKEGRLKEAQYHAVKAFLVCDEPTYTPRAMLLAIEIFHAQNKDQDARETWKELQERYPSFAQQHAGDPVMRAIRKPLQPVQKKPKAKGGKQTRRTKNP